MGADLRDFLRASLKRHPRVAYQGFFPDAAAWSHLADAVPALVPFPGVEAPRGGTYHSALWLLDWDHRLPSRALLLRLYAFHTDAARQRAMFALDAREQEIAREDRFPEFDVPDFAGLPADEAYEADLDPKGLPNKLRLVSEWRREIDPVHARKAIDVVRRSAAFAELRKGLRRRPAGLGDLEASEWSPPCESGHSRWALDVWYLVAFNGVVGEGHAFLVDLDEGAIVKERDFQFRSG